MKPRVGEAIEIAGVVVMQMGDDDVPDAVGLDAKVRQRIDRIERQLAGTRLRLFGVEAGIDQDVAAAAADQPDEIIEVLRRGLVRIGDQKIHVGGARRHRRIAQRVDFVGISHRCHFSFLGCRDLADGGTKPLSSAKVKPARLHGSGMAGRQNQCERGHIDAPSAKMAIHHPKVVRAATGCDARTGHDGDMSGFAAKRMSGDREPSALQFIPAHPARRRRGELSQLMSTPQAVDVLRPRFDNAGCVE